MIEVPVDIVRMGQKACWLYCYLALLEIEGKETPGERQLAMMLDVSRRQLRYMLEDIKKMVTEPKVNQKCTKSEPKVNQTLADNQSVKCESEPKVNQKCTKSEPKVNHLREKETSSSPPLTPSSTKEKEKEKEITLMGKEIAAADAATHKRELLEKRSQVFYNRLIPYVEKFGKEIVRAFYNYWSEPDISYTKMRFEKEKTFEVGRRLSTWKNNEMRFGTSGKTEVGKQVTDTQDKDYGGDDW